MVKIIEIEEDFMSEDEEQVTDEEEKDDGIDPDIDEKPPDAPVPPDPPLALDPSSGLEPSTVAEPDDGPSTAAEGIQRLTIGPGTLPPALRVGLSPRHTLDVATQYSNYLELQRALERTFPLDGPEGLNNWAIDYRQLGRPRLPNGCGVPNFASLTSPRTPPLAEQPLTGLNSELVATDSATASQPNKDKAAQNKTDSNESIKEKSDGASEENQLAPKTIIVTKATIFSSPILSDCDLSDVSDSQVPMDYETLQAELNAKCTSHSDLEYTSSLTNCPCTQSVDECTGGLDADPVLAEAVDRKGPFEAFEEGEAACLPASSIVEDCWEQYVNDDRLFTVTTDVHAPSTSRGDRVPSPVSPATERRRVKLENRRQARELQRSAIRNVTRCIQVPTEKVGRILGKGGRRIREIEKKSGTIIKVQQRHSNLPVTLFNVHGSIQGISLAVQEICTIIRNFKPASPGEANTASVSCQEELELKQLLLGIKNQVLEGEKRSREPKK